MRQVFVDTGGFFANAVKGNKNHQHTQGLFKQAKAERWRLVTTNAVIFETYTLILKRPEGGRDKAIQFLAFMERAGRGALQIVRLTEEDEQAAVALVRAHADKRYSLCDAASFAVMERLGIAEAIAFDKDFRSYGRFVML